MSSPHTCRPPGCFETTYDSDYCEKCLAGNFPNQRGWITYNEWMRAKIVREDDYQKMFSRMTMNTDQLKVILDSYAYWYPEEGISERADSVKTKSDKCERPIRKKKKVSKLVGFFDRIIQQTAQKPTKLNTSDKKPSTVNKKLVSTRKGVSKNVFLSYASEDYSKVISVYRKLEERGHKPWMDRENLLAGQNWELEIENAVEKSDFFIAFFSKRSVPKIGYVQREISIGLKYLTCRPPEKRFLLPVRLDDCEVPKTVRNLHWISIRSKDFYKKLLTAIES